MSWTPNFPKRSLNSHKGDFGRVGIVAGSAGMIGAAIMSAKAALRSGAGVVYLLTIESAAPFIASELPEVVVVPCPETDGALGISSLGTILEAVERFRFTALGIGPGLGRLLSTQQMVQDLVPMVVSESCPVVIDADGLMAHDASRLEAYPSKTVVLTPHLGEFDHVFKMRPTTESARMADAETASSLSKQVVVLKGANTVVAPYKEPLYVNKTGNPGMATAGSGDVLLGVVSAFCGQGMDTVSASKSAVYVHGLAGDIAAQELGEYSLMATDIIDAIPKSIQECSS